MTTVFLTGTDTEVGKTYVAVHLLRAVSGQGLRCAGFKPVAAGAENRGGGWRNADALALQSAANTALPYETINPYCFAPPIAPHLAAREAGEMIQVGRVMAAHAEIAGQADWVLVEGAGGWRVPLNDDLEFADLAADAGWPVLLVVGMRLGCINHALLTAESVQKRCHLLGWMANCLPPAQPRLRENIATLERRMPAPLLGIFPADGEKPEKLQLQVLLGR